VVTQVPDRELTSVEQTLVEHVRRGEWLDLAAEGEPVDEASMRSWGESRTCRASVIRDLLRGRLAADPDPHGLRLRGARISGRLDLENLTTDVTLELRDCLLEEGVLARDGRLAGLDLAGCQLEHPDKSPLDAGRLTCSKLDLSGARIIGSTDLGAVHLLGARIGGNLECDGAELRNDSGPALVADGLQVGQAMYLRSGFTATGSGGHGAVRLFGAHIGGLLNCTGAKLRNDSGPALSADGLQVGLGLFLRGGFTATGSGDRGAVRLLGAHIGSSLECDGAELRNDSGPALTADGLQVGLGLFLRGGFTATGSGGAGAVRLFGARIGVNLECTMAELRNDSGSALVADGLQVDGAMYLRDGFTATGSGGYGAVRLLGAHIGGLLDCTGAELRNDSGPALSADGLQVGLSLFLRGGFTAIGSGDRGAVRLLGAHIGGLLDCTGAEVRNDSGPALAADGLQVDGAMYLSDFTATGGGRDVAVSLTDARVGGTLRFDPARLEHAANPCRRLAVAGLTYAGVPEQVSAQGWLRLLRDGTPGYAAQPYRQLAAGCRALGAERQAREVLMAQRDDELARADTRWQERLWGKITKVTLGYGYQPWRALLFLAAVVALSCVLAVVLGAHGALAQTRDTVASGQPCTVIQRVSVGLDLNLPVGTTLARAGCGLPRDAASATAAWLVTAGWVLRVLAWVFAALFIAGFTGAVRKT
jgi:hypothetical protein